MICGSSYRNLILMILQFFKHSFFVIQFAVVPTDLDSFCFLKFFGH
ncbi:hypothetical protein LEP1GSC127_3777 [Leptospira kirschneri str. 200801925]|nr:hypothetical protein LEP1GSC127_3777 [Leptospira kirschneri str. 200801925]